jgi:hypothetical protein
MRNNYKSEFPNFDFEIPFLEGFTDRSWKNDVCPSFYSQFNATHDLVIWIDYKDKDLREVDQGYGQFTLCLNPINDEELDIESDDNIIFTTDSWEELVNKINQTWGAWA